MQSFVLLPLQSLAFVIINKEKWKGKSVFLFCNKAFLMMTNFFLWTQKACLTNVLLKTFFTICTKQEKEAEHKKARRTSARTKSNLGRMSSMKAVRRVVILILNFLQLICSQGRKIVVSFNHIHKQISLERKHSEWFGMNGHITNFQASLLNIYVGDEWWHWWNILTRSLAL